MLRFAIAITATIELAYFLTELPYPLRKMIHPADRGFDLLSMLCMVFVAPLLAVAAIALVAMGWRTRAAAILLGVAPLVYWTPALAVFIARLMKG